MISSDTFNNQFQMGMLASFESFSQTASNRLPEPGELEDEEDTSNFHGGAQADRADERTGVDTFVVNSHYARSEELAHPKLDALVESMADAWTTGKKSLVWLCCVDASRGWR